MSQAVVSPKLAFSLNSVGLQSVSPIEHNGAFLFEGMHRFTLTAAYVSCSQPQPTAISFSTSR